MWLGNYSGKFTGNWIGLFGESSGPNTWIYTGSGGGLSGGTALLRIVRVFTGAGGATSGGDAGYARVLTYVSSGGGVSGGTAGLTLVYVSSSSGGATSGGLASYRTTKVYVGDGGGSSGGTGGERTSKTYVGSGGGLSAGSASIVRIATFIGSGGGISGGAGSIVVTLTYVGSGGGQSAGAGASRFLRYIERPLQYTDIPHHNNILVLPQGQNIVVSTGNIVVPILNGNTIDVPSLLNNVQIEEPIVEVTNSRAPLFYALNPSENDARVTASKVVIVSTEQNDVDNVVAHNNLVAK